MTLMGNVLTFLTCFMVGMILMGDENENEYILLYMKGAKKFVCVFVTAFCDSKKLRPNNYITREWPQTVHILQ